MASQERYTGPCPWEEAPAEGKCEMCGNRTEDGVCVEGCEVCAYCDTLTEYCDFVKIRKEKMCKKCASEVEE